jgi:hypothetical protein
LADALASAEAEVTDVSLVCSGIDLIGEKSIGGMGLSRHAAKPCVESV